MTILEDIKAGRLVVVPVVPEQPMLEAGEVALVGVLHDVDYFMPDDGMRRVLSAALSASPDHTPALLALIEERDALQERAERAETLKLTVASLKNQLAAESERAGRLEASLRAAEVERGAVEKAMGVDAVRFMDPPDGGDPTLAEMVANMRQQLDATEAERDRLKVERDTTAADCEAICNSYVVENQQLHDRALAAESSSASKDAELLALAEERDRLREALAFYACDAANCDCVPGEEQSDRVACGFKARRTLTGDTP